MKEGGGKCGCAGGPSPSALCVVTVECTRIRKEPARGGERVREVWVLGSWGLGFQTLLVFDLRRLNLGAQMT